MNTYDAYLETDNQVKGTRIHSIVHARSHEEAMDLALEVNRLDYGTVEKITVIPRKEA